MHAQSARPTLALQASSDATSTSAARPTRDLHRISCGAVDHARARRSTSDAIDETKRGEPRERLALRDDQRRSGAGQSAGGALVHQSPGLKMIG